MAPLIPTWAQPSHPSIQEVIFSSSSNGDDYTTKSISRISVPPFGVFATLDYPPCSRADEATYATVQCGKGKNGEGEHLNLNSDLVYINHSCDPSLLFDLSTSPSNPVILAGPRGLAPGDELTFFYPSTEWSMAQPFACICNTPHCRGEISGARDMTPQQLEGVWLNGFIRELLAEKDNSHASKAETASNSTVGVEKANGGAAASNGVEKHTGSLNSASDSVEQMLVALLEQTRIAVQLAEEGLVSYRKKRVPSTNGTNAGNAGHGHEDVDASVAIAGNGRAGPTSRELSGEMGGDTAVTV